MRGKILIVEDFSDWRELLSGLLRREGHEVETAGGYAEAQALLAESRDLDLAILDIRLAEGDEANQDGMNLLAEIRQQQPTTRVILVSGHGTMDTVRRAFRDFRAFDFFRKEQFDSDEFRQAVRDAVEQAARERRDSRDKEYMRSHRYDKWQREQRGT